MRGGAPRVESRCTWGWNRGAPGFDCALGTDGAVPKKGAEAIRCDPSNLRD